MIDTYNLFECWGTAIWRASWQGGLTALAVWLVISIVPTIPARFQCWLWRLVMLKFLFAFVWSTPIELPLLPPSQSMTTTTIESKVLDLLPTESVQVDDYNSYPRLQPLLVAFVVWIVVVLGQMTRLVIACCEARRYRHGCHPCEDRHLINELHRSCKLAGFTTPPLLLESTGQGSPLLVGILRPAMVLPTITMSRLNASEHRLVICHELAHIMRRDLVCRLVAAIIRSVFFFHPLAWFSERQLSLSQELAADELAIEIQNQDPAKYAALLVSVVSKLGPGPMVPTMSVGAVGSSKSLRQRLCAMRFMKPIHPRGVVVYGLILGLASVPSLVPWSVVAMTALAAEQAEQQVTTIKGKFESFQDGILKVKVKTEQNDVWKVSEWKLAESIEVLSHIRGTAQKGVAANAFKQWERGAEIAVTIKDGTATFVEIGSTAKVEREPDRIPNAVGNKADTKAASAQDQKSGWGEFVSFKDSVLKLESNAGAPLIWKNIQNAKTLVWSQQEGVYVPKNMLEALSQTKARTWTSVRINNEGIVIHIGAKKGQVTGTYVSYKNDRLLMLGKNLGESFTKKYGNNMQFNKFRDDVPFYESIDGSEYKLIGNANKVLSDIKEGTVLTIHSEGDDNITRIDMGLPNTKDPPR